VTHDLLSVTRGRRRLLATVLLLAAAGCGPAPQPPRAVDPATFDAEHAFFELRSLVAITPRDSGTPGAEKAAFHLQRRLQALGVEAQIDVFTNRSPQGMTVFRNVIGRIPGTSTGLVLLASHYDTKSGIGPGFQGANDSGSSSGVLLQLARVFAKGPRLGPELQFVFFDGEECMQSYGPNDGLQGSRHYARRLVDEGRNDEVLGVIVMDMIGDQNLTVTLPRNGTSRLMTAVLNASYAENARNKFSLHPFEIGDDHVPFLELGMPAVDIIDFDYGSAPGRNDYWHTLEDTVDKISVESLGIIGRVVIRVVNDLAGAK
jgi:glutaminyl-peptide cyclotransferase